MSREGAIGIIENSAFYDTHEVVRVVRVGKVMWKVERWGRHWTGSEIMTGWGPATTRKVSRFIEFPEGTAASEAYARLKLYKEQMDESVKKARATYNARVKAMGASE